MTETILIPVVMAGGTGSRLWPLSRESYPKQFLKLYNQLTMLQETIQRLDGLVCNAPIVITNEQHRFIVAEQLRQIGKLSHNIILEPVGRNTAPAIALAAFTVIAQYPEKNVLLLVLAADHVIKDSVAFQKTVVEALNKASQGALITFGIKPSFPETGYGYIKRGRICTNDNNCNITRLYEVSEFVEKPSREIAEKYIASGEYYWNSGMFLFSADAYLKELKKYNLSIYEACNSAIDNAERDMDFIRVSEDDFTMCPSDSIDYAVMEKTDRAILSPLDVGWNDVGSWLSLWELSDKDSNGNVFCGDVISHDCNNSYIRSDSSLVATVGLDNVVIIQTKDVTLVAAKDRVQEIKSIIKELKVNDRKEVHTHKNVYRPWGEYTSIDEGERYKVRGIIVKPSEGLTLRMHHHRSEHWIVVSGTARVTMEEKVQLLVANQSIYIPQGAIYSLENPGVIPLHLIEISSGDYLGEDDIVRFSERYK
ncbi:mannose-1-phosphate guanylyltransferase/mannose-6-phosphate isomerase [Yokenella regensburgei]|uniref:mannose-1-phosphate guanylyltransferase/mannose-6-phosphate isomerase n=1 Tax=Yokenella regensburgei TaxID=158877 RepID=UPI003EDABFBC